MQHIFSYITHNVFVMTHFIILIINFLEASSISYTTHNRLYTHKRLYYALLTTHFLIYYTQNTGRINVHVYNTIIHYIPCSFPYNTYTSTILFHINTQHTLSHTLHTTHSLSLSVLPTTDLNINICSYKYKFAQSFSSPFTPINFLPHVH